MYYYALAFTIARQAQVHLGTIVVGMAGEMILSRCFVLCSCKSGAGGTLPSPRQVVVLLASGDKSLAETLWDP